MADEVFAMLRSGALKIEIGAAYSLGEAPAAHAALESGTTTNSIILVP
jgi:NADPH2:quinone reductase